MVLTYLDTNVIDHLAKGPSHLDPKTAESLTSVIKSRKLIPLTSSYQIEELLAGTRHNVPASMMKLALLQDLTGYRNFLKPVDHLLQDAIVGYAEGRAPANLFLDDTPLHGRLQSLLDATTLDLKALNLALKSARDDVRRYRETMQSNIQKSVDHGFPEPPFELWYRTGAPQLAELFAQGKEVREGCLERGIDGLLAIPVLAVLVGYYLSVIYEYSFHRGLKVDMGDSRDTLHAISASCADVIISFDNKFCRRLERIPRGPRVISKGSLAEFLREITRS